MNFYSEICANYDEIFAFKEATYKFLKQNILKEGKVLDVACATGEYSIAFNKDNFKVNGIDLDGEMIKLAKLKNNEISFEAMNMLHINSLENSYDLIFCIGNSLVHLQSLRDVDDFLKQLFEKLNSNGWIKLQIINYDRIIKQKITSLPTIKTDRLTFIRDYKLTEDERFVEFATKLIIKDQSIENSVKLLTLNREELETLLTKNGFRNISFYGNFKMGTLSSESQPLIVEAQKV